MKQVLVADDNSTSRELIRAIMENAGYGVIEAANGYEALECAHVNQADLIVLDLHMPGMDGLSIVTELRRNCKFSLTPIIALTACAMPGDQERAMAAGFDSYISKPISISALRQKMVYFLEGWPASRAAGCSGR